MGPAPAPATPPPAEPTPLHRVGRAVTLRTDAENLSPEGATAPALPPGVKGRIVAEESAPPAAPPPGAPAGVAAPTPLQRRSAIVEDLSAALGTPVRIGHMGTRIGERLRGLYKERPDVIRARVANDVPTVAHEVGHALEAHGVADESFLRAHAAELEPIASPGPEGSELSEGFAEFLRRYLTEPGAAEVAAPRFHAAFESHLESHPEVRDMLQTARRDYRRWQEQPAVAKVLSQIADKGARRQQFSARGWLKSLYRNVIDDLAPLQDFARAAAGDTPLPALEDPYVQGRLVRGWSGKAEHFLDYGPLDFNDLTQKLPGKALSEILGPVAGDLDNFRAYLVSRRSLRLRTRGIESGVDEAAARETAQTLDSPHFQTAAGELATYQDQLLKYLRDSGILTADSYDRIHARADDFVPFYRLIEEDRGGGSGGGGTTFGNLFNPVRRIRGSGREIIDPLESIIKNTYAFVHLAERNRVGRAVVDLAERTPGMGAWVERLPPSMRPMQLPRDELISSIVRGLGDETPAEDRAEVGEILQGLPQDVVLAFRPSLARPTDVPALTVFQRGKPVTYQVHPELQNAMLGLDREGSNTLMRLLSKPASWLRAGATLAPEFALRNPMRDQFTALVQSRYGFMPGVDFVRGLAHVVRGDDLYQLWLRSGAPHGAMVSLDRDYLQRSLGEVLGGERALPDVIRHPLSHLKDFAQMLSEAGEEATRVGDFAKGIRKEGRTPEGLARAAFNSREVTVDFARIGAKTQAVNSLVAFWNASNQGVDRIVRSFHDDPAGSTLRVMAGITLPSMLLWYANHDDPRVKQLPQWQRDLFWIIPTKDRLWRIPKPFELGVLFGSLPERLLDLTEEHSPDVIRQWGQQFLNAVTPGTLTTVGGVPLPLPVPTILAPLIENASNWSMFTDRPIIPRAEQDVAPAYQGTLYSSELARRVGEALNYPPAKIDNLIRGWTGGVGALTVDALDQALVRARSAPLPEPPERTLADLPGIRGFIARWPTTQAQPIEDFYRRYQASGEALRTVKFLERGDPAQAADYARAHEQELMEGKALAQVAKALGSYRGMIGHVYADRTMSPAEKRTLVDNFTQEMIDLAHGTLQRLQPGPPVAVAPPVRENRPGGFGDVMQRERARQLLQGR